MGPLSCYIAALFDLNNEVILFQYIGSFPISGSYVDNLGRRIDSFQPTTSGGMQSVELSISVLGVKICCEKVIAFLNCFSKFKYALSITQSTEKFMLD